MVAASCVAFWTEGGAELLHALPGNVTHADRTSYSRADLTTAHMPPFLTTAAT